MKKTQSRHEKPLERASGRPPVSADQKKRFLRALGLDHRVDLACKEAGISRSGAYQLRAKDPTFAVLWDAMLETLPSRVHDVYIEEALEGRIKRDDAGQPILDEHGEPVRERNTALLRDLGRKHLQIPAGNQVNVGVQVNQTQLPEPPADGDPRVLELWGVPSEPLAADYEDITGKDEPDDCSDLV